MASWRDESQEIAIFIADSIVHHARGRWDRCAMDSEDQHANAEALISGARIFTAHIEPSSGRKIWIITEARDARGRREATTVLFPEEY